MVPAGSGSSSRRVRDGGRRMGVLSLDAGADAGARHAAAAQLATWGHSEASGSQVLSTLARVRNASGQYCFSMDRLFGTYSERLILV